MLDAAAREGASVHENASVATVSTSATGVELTVETARGSVRMRAKLVAGADGVNSVVAQSQGLTMDDPRRIAIARRAYASVAPAADRSGAADFFYEESSFPGYGWLFPARDGLVNIGVGLLAETRSRSRAHVPELFSRFVEQLRLHHPRCAELELVSKPIGGVVKMYGGAGPNHFDGGVLIGDAGCFVDPMTGEGITPGMESALIAAPVLLGALEAGDARAGRLAAFESAFRSYFDPSMLFLDFCAGMVRNQHFARPWLKGIARAYQVANSDPGFARLCGSYFGGLEVRPFDMMRLAWLRAMEEVALAWPRALSGARDPARAHGATSPSDLIEWQTALFRSLTRDPRWHFSWSVDLQRQWAKMRAAAARVDRDPRAEGLLFAGA
jgi:2-polyprenyl-6-methoxyphenol hydroxylase-like FAD-dependent oxidoreductase